MAHDHHHHAPAGHGHAHGHHTDIDWAEMGPVLESQAELLAPLYREAMGWLAEETPSRA